ncbi:TRAP transporter small permease subunit [Verticiella sediminum]|nr:TRAP transporter small permease [Verticiella sediminum]
MRFTFLMARVTDRIALAAGWWLLMYATVVCIEIVARKFLQTSIQGIDEVGGYTLAVVAAVGYSGALLSRSHTRVDFVLNRLPVRMRCVLNVTAMVLLAILAGLLAEGGWRVLEESLEFQSRSTSPLQAPLYVPQAVWLAGLVLFFLTALVLCVESIVLAVSKGPAAVNQRFGPPSLEEEIRAEAGLEVREPAAARPATATLAPKVQS